MQWQTYYSSLLTEMKTVMGDSLVLLLLCSVCSEVPAYMALLILGIYWLMYYLLQIYQCLLESLDDVFPCA